MEPREIEQGRLYRDLADIMPLISPPGEYAEEAAHWRTVLREKLGEGKHPILELGVGGGYNLSHLSHEFEATAVDISESMLALCRQLNPGVELHLGDMRRIRLGRKFSAVLIHDAVSTMLSEADVSAAFGTAAAHLNPGGVLIASPDRYGETFREPEIEKIVHSDCQRKLACLEYTYDPDPGDTAVETIMVFLIESQGRLRIELDRHVTGLFPLTTWIRLMDEAGFRADVHSFVLGEDNRPYDLLVGVLR